MARYKRSVRKPSRSVVLALAALLVATGATSACSGGGTDVNTDQVVAKSDKDTKKKAKKKAKKSDKNSKKSSKKKKTTTSKAKKKAVPKLTSRTFVATDLGDQKVVKGSTVSVTFGDGKITVEPGCTTLTGTATWDAENLSITGDGLVATPKACHPKLIQQDVWVQALLEAKPSFTLKGKTMEITDGFSSMTLKERT